MAHVLYATMLVHPSKGEQVRRYLYGATEVVEAAPVHRYAADGSRTIGDLVYLILRTEERDAVRTEHAQQQQADRLASGMLAMTVGFDTRAEARAYAGRRAEASEWGLGDFAPFVLSAVSA